MIAYERFKNALTRGVLKPLYLFSGEERYFKERLFGEIKKYLGSNHEFNYEELDGQEVLPEEVVAKAETVSFFGQRFIVVKNCRFFSGKHDEEPLLNYLKNPAPQAVVIFSTELPIDKKKKIYQEFLKNGEEIEFSRLDEKEVQELIKTWADRAGFNLEREALIVLAQSYGQNLVELEKEFKKLVLYKLSEKTITLKDVLEVSGQDQEISVFYLVEELLSGKINRPKLKERLTNQEEAVKFTGLVAKNLRQIYTVKVLQQKGKTLQEIAKITGIPEWLVKKTLRSAVHLSQEKLKKGITALADLDVKIKSGERELTGLFERFFLLMKK
ncbi:DNA polymerase III subunit delta [Carboxydothermus ferrireducens]|uniref:DNA polymerase III subunit delta n=1 Tax=Carboxydothermus ferrireducens DSM 11255 TaxID=1119529 RepID=A0ABX2R546_9THEO|nr:DNA polymerase III subunit delta [Carboxydothermus ferrireducens]NYE56298.1 DNA polymerase-3 subunit delta [Carboxydothermus ferrireducens DSM 11255]